MIITLYGAGPAHNAHIKRYNIAIVAWETYYIYDILLYKLHVLLLYNIIDIINIIIVPRVFYVIFFAPRREEETAGPRYSQCSATIIIRPNKDVSRRD